MIQRINEFGRIIGDDAPYATLYYRDLPDGFGFKAIDQHEDTPLTSAIWADMISYSERFYADWEIVGNTVADFQRRLQLCYDRGVDTFERLMQVYQDDIAKPILGRSEIVTYDLTNEGENHVSDQGERVNVPLDNPENDKANERDRSTNTAQGRNTQKGTVKTELSDLGVRPNYESLNGFLDANRPNREVFAEMFRECFQIFEGYTF